MYNNFNASGSPPLPDIIGQYYPPFSGAYGNGIGISNYGAVLPPLGATTAFEMYGPSTSAGYLYEPQLYGQTSPIRRRRYSIAGLPSATMMNDFYGYPTAAPLQQSSSSNIVNLLSEANKSISRSSQILNLTNQARQFNQPITPMSTHYPGRIVSSYPTLHPGDTSPPYINDNLLQMSSSFSSQPNMYFQQYGQPAQQTAAGVAAAGLGGTRLRPAFSVSNLNYLNYPNKYTIGGGSVGGGISGLGGLGGGYTTSTNPYLNQSDLQTQYGGTIGATGLGGLAQQRNLMSSLHASNPAISQYYQQQQQLQQPSASSLAYNLQQQFAGTQHYAHQMPTSGHPSTAGHIQQSVQQQLHPQYQYHVHQHQNHLQTHPLASLTQTTGPFGGTLTSSARDAATSAYDNMHATSAAAYQQQHHQLHHPHHHHHHHHHPQQLHQHQQQQHHAPSTSLGHAYPHHHHHLPYSKLDLDYPKLPQEHKRQVSFKFDVDTLSLDS